MSAVTVRIPACPSRDVSPNHRHATWHARNRAMQAAKEVAGWAMQVHAPSAREVAQAWPARAPLRVTIEIGWARGRHRADIDNASASCKPTIDSVFAAIGLDDRQVEELVVRQTRDPAGDGYTDVRVEPIGGEA